MPTVTVSQINEKLQSLPPQKLVVVFDFVSYLAEQETKSDSLDWGVAWAWIGHWLGI